MKEVVQNVIKNYFRIIATALTALFSFTSFFMASFLIYVYLYDIPRYTIIGEMPASIRGTIEFVRDIPYWTYKIKPVSLPMYRLYIDADEYQKIIDALPESGDEVLSDELRTKVPALFVYNGKKMDVKVNLHGDMYNNWIFKKKSWQIRFQNGELFDGTSKINLLLPDDEAVYAGEHVNTYRAKKMGLAAPNDKFIVLQINDGPKMLYYQKEGWTPEFLVKNFRNSSGNLYGEAGALTDPIFESTMWWKKFNSVAGEENNFSDLAYLLDLIKNADDNAFKDAIVKIIDMDTFYTWQIHSMLAGSVHQDENHNMRIYFDKEKQRFFLIAWDVSVWDYVEKFERPRFGKVVYDLDVNYNPLVNRILNIPEFLLERNRRLWEYVKDDTNINEDIAYLDQATEKIKPAVFQDTQKYDRNGKADATMRRVRSNLLSNYAFLHEQLGKSNFFTTLSYQSTSTIATIDFSYVSASPINFNGLRISRVSSSPFNSFLLYEDSNRNGQFDWPDAKIANLKYENGMLSARKLDLLLYSDRIDNDYYEPITVRMTDKKFFVVAPLPFTIQNPNISFDLFNAITGTIINSLIHVNNREPFF